MPIDLLYLDAWDYSEGEAAKISEESHLDAFKIIENSLSDRALILIDDIHDTESFKGKGSLVIPYLLNKGYKILYLGYQCLLSKKEARVERFSQSAIPCLEGLDSQKAFEYFKEAVTFQGRSQFDEAIMLYQKTTKIKPDYDMAYYNLGNIFREKGNSNDAENCYQKVLQINPTHEWAHFNLGIINKENGQLNKAIDHYHKTLHLNPNIEEAHLNLGIIFQEKGQLDKAIACHYNALQLNPYYAEAYLNLGKAFEDIDLIDEALTCYQKATKIKPTLEDGYGSLLVKLFSTGNLKKILKAFERRWKKIYSYKKIEQPFWDGSDIKGLTILLHEQGFGDTIQFIRYAPLVRKHGAKVIFECQRSLFSLLKDVEGANQIILEGEQLPKYDVHAPLFSLPIVFNTAPDSVPADIPYIAVDSILVRKWREKLEHDKCKLKIGLFWCTGSQYKSCSLDEFSPLAQLNDITFYSLQKKRTTKRTANLPNEMRLVDYTEDIYDFLDTAAFMENLDLVISIDTAVAHLAGALGKPVWTILPFGGDWRWSLNYDNTPWYPTMKLFRQSSHGDWESVIAKVRDELLNLLDSN